MCFNRVDPPLEMWKLLRFGENVQICVICSYSVKIIILLNNAVVCINYLLESTPQMYSFLRFGENLHHICVICSSSVKIIILLKNTVNNPQILWKCPYSSNNLVEIIILLKNTVENPSDLVQMFNQLNLLKIIKLLRNTVVYTEYPQT